MRIATALIATMLCGCSHRMLDTSLADGSMIDGPSATTLCSTGYAMPTEISVAETEFVEASGVVASRSDPDVLWLHNDSGDTARIFAVATDGSALGRLHLPGVTAIDFEDIAAATCPDGTGACIWVSDTGNNNHDRTDQTVYAVAEPVVSKSAPLGEAMATRIWHFPVSFPAGVHIDAEALIVSADGSALFLFEKVDAMTARIFGSSGPLVDQSTTTLTEVGTVTSPGVPVPKGLMITGADLHPSGTRILLRVYTGIFEYQLVDGNWPGNLDAADREVVIYGPASEPQGEAVAYDQSGTGVWSISEDPQQQMTRPLHHYACE